MRIHVYLIAVMLVALGGCAHDAASERNYAGSSGSTYDAALNPAQTRGVVIYDPTSPIVPYDYGNSSGSGTTR